ncbi:unnamed protein product [Ixodes pacificus]
MKASNLFSCLLQSWWLVMEVPKKASGCKGRRRTNVSIHGRSNFCQGCLQSNPERNRCLLYPAVVSKHKKSRNKKKKKDALQTSVVRCICLHSATYLTKGTGNVLQQLLM